MPSTCCWAEPGRANRAGRARRRRTSAVRSSSLLLQRLLVGVNQVAHGLLVLICSRRPSFWALAAGRPLRLRCSAASAASSRCLGRLEIGLWLHGLILSPIRSIALASALSDLLFLIRTSVYLSPNRP